MKKFFNRDDRSSIEFFYSFSLKTFHINVTFYNKIDKDNKLKS